MQNIIAFFIRNRNFFFFLALLSLSLVFTFQSHSYHRSKFINSANWLTGGVYESVNNISSYFDLKEQNQKLVEENLRLRNLILNQGENTVDSLIKDSTNNLLNYRIKSATVIKNSYNKTKNYILINKGKKDGIKQDLGVITTNGIVGIIDNTSSGHSTVQSVLNSLSEINAQLKNTSHFGTLEWDTKKRNIVQLTDIPDLANPQVGDTIITGGMSTIFPKNIPIGTIMDFKFDDSENYYIINVKLFNDMTSLEHVYIIENMNTDEIKQLENLTNEQ
ncbi:rod shape-determining protein MreC [Leptobacterium flavescens]|uniref:Cell shape-determining protein MreC n=1 Tax=Leptobacterium flavescens TaxID=472055 RepID=A0A6P0UQP0_9FLAO|nr:rod shape-determining protein MreC [Leptobacterium flavescens]NER14800.1 rod shape-determining protein MreC [Leptobacterium flavescens]